MRYTKLIRKKRCVLFLIVTAILSAAAADDTRVRLGRAVAAINTLTESHHGIRPKQIANADCVAVIPGFKKGAAVVGVGYGRGFISGRKDGGWSAPAAVTLESGSVGVQVGGEEIDIVILSLDPSKRAKLLSERFAVGTDASAAWATARRRTRIPTSRSYSSGIRRECSAGLGWMAPRSCATSRATRLFTVRA